MNRRARWSVALGLALTFVGTSITAASAADPPSYYAQTIAPSGPANWLGLGTVVPGTSGDCTTQLLNRVPGAAPGNLCSPIAATAGPFPSDPNDPTPAATGTQIGINGSAAQRSPSPSSFQVTFWWRPGAGFHSGTRFNLWGSQAYYASGHLLNDSGGLYLNTTDDAATLHFGQVGGTDHWFPFAAPYGLTQWQMITLSLKAGVLSVYIGSTQLQDSVLPAAGWGNSGSHGGGAQLSFAQDLNGTGSAFWGYGEWFGHAADAITSQCDHSGGVSDTGQPIANLCVGNGSYLQILQLGVGSGQLPQVNGAPTSSGSGTINGVCVTKGVISGACKYQIPSAGYMALSDCSGKSLSVTDLGGDVDWLACNLGNTLRAIANVGIGALNAVIFGLNALIDLVLPSDHWLDPVTAVYPTLQDHSPFSYMVGIAALLPGIFTAGATSPDLSFTFLGHTVAAPFSVPLGFVQPYRPLLVALLYVATAFILYRSIRRSLDG
jgi:hypothetical protein